MELDELKVLLSDPEKLITEIGKSWTSTYEQAKYNAYDPLSLTRKVNDTAVRKDKLISYPTDAEDVTTGKPVMGTKVEYVTRIAIPLQELIVNTLTAFIT